MLWKQTLMADAVSRNVPAIQVGDDGNLVEGLQHGECFRGFHITIIE